MSYPPQGPMQPGINPAFLPSQGPGESAPPYPVDPPPGYSTGYPPAAGYQPGGYPPSQGGYPPPAGYVQPMENVPPSGYPQPMENYPPAGYPQPMENFPPAGYPQPGGYPPPGPMTHQPSPGVGYPQPGGEGNWMPIPTGIPVCPPGLEYLTMIDQLLVHQKVELLEAFLGFETKNKYTIKNSMGQKVYTAKEDTDCCTRNCCGTARPFDMKIKNMEGNEVIHLIRDFRCDSCLCPCFLQRLEVMSPPGTLIGVVAQEWSILAPKFRVENESGETVLRIKGPFCTFSICGDVEFEVLSTNGVKVGKITKQWSGLLREAFTDSDHFGISFPMDLDVKMKAVLLGALFLIDYMFFEKSGNNESDSPGML